MPFRNNAYHDPNIGKGFNNMAGMFAPPTGTDLYGYAHAGKTLSDMARQKAAVERIRSGSATPADYVDAGVASPVKEYALADMYKMASQPGADPRTLDARSYAVNGNAGNTFLGHQQTLDVQTANNVRDNTAKVQVAGMSPVSKDQVRYLPPSVLPSLGYKQPDDFSGAPPSGGVSGLAGMFTPTAQNMPASNMGVPAAPPSGMVQTGAMETTRGKDLYMPNGVKMDGQVLSNNTPNSVDEFRAQQVAKMDPTDPIRQAVVAGDVKTENVQGPNGPMVATVPQAIGKAPVNTAYANAQAPDLVKYADTIRANEMQAGQRRQALDTLANLAAQNQDDMGKWATAKTEVARALKSVGFDAGNTAPMEAFKAFANQQALNLRQNMPGSMSDADREFLLGSGINPNMSYDAATRVLGILDKTQNTIPLTAGQKLREYTANHNGQIDENFRNEISKLVNPDPKADAPQAAGAAPQPAATPAETAEAAPAKDAAAAPKRLKYNMATGLIE